jgi:hypothetical protein
LGVSVTVAADYPAKEAIASLENELYFQIGRR